MASVVYSAECGTFAEFAAAYDSVEWRGKYFQTSGGPLLYCSVTNRDTDARIAITNRLLDDGADPSVVGGAINVLHAYFGFRGHDPERDPALLARLLDGGADVNLVSKRWGPPLVLFMKNGPLPVAGRVPFYDVIFSRPELDLSVWSGSRDYSLRDYILRSAPGHADLKEYVRECDRQRGVTDGD